jgi:hypothetical protein
MRCSKSTPTLNRDGLPTVKTYRGPVYVLQVATIGGIKLGFEYEPAGAWIDHDVYLDREEAEERARLHETLPVIDSSGNDITSHVTTVARVITFDQLKDEFGDDRGYLVTTMFNKRLSELFADLPDDE